MTRLKKIKMRVRDIKVSFFVRRSLDEDRVLEFAEAMLAGATFPLIHVTADGVLVNGRHRLAAMQLNDLDEVWVYVVPAAPVKDLIPMALADNMGGSKPPSRSDINFACEQALAAGTTGKALVATLMQYYPRSVATRFVDHARTQMKRRATRDAIDAIAEGMTIAAAAAKFKLKPETIRAALGGRRKKVEVDLVANSQQALSNRMRSMAQFNRGAMDKLTESMEDGGHTKADVLTFVEHMAQAGKRMVRQAADWKARVEAISKNGAHQ